MPYHETDLNYTNCMNTENVGVFLVLESEKPTIKCSLSHIMLYVTQNNIYSALPTF